MNQKNALFILLITAVVTVSGCASGTFGFGDKKLPGDCKLTIDPNANTYDMEGRPECVELLIKAFENPAIPGLAPKPTVAPKPAKKKGWFK